MKISVAPGNSGPAIKPADLELAIETTEIALRYTVANGGSRDYFRGCLVALYYVRDTPDWIEATKLVNRLILSWEANNVT